MNTDVFSPEKRSAVMRRVKGRDTSPELAVRAILRAGTYELIERKDVPVAVIVTEYVEIAQAFFQDEEPKLVNAVLDRIARQIRTDVRS